MTHADKVLFVLYGERFYGKKKPLRIMHIAKTIDDDHDVASAYPVLKRLFAEGKVGKAGFGYVIAESGVAYIDEKLAFIDRVLGAQ